MNSSSNYIEKIQTPLENGQKTIQNKISLVILGSSSILLNEIHGGFMRTSVHSKCLISSFASA